MNEQRKIVRACGVAALGVVAALAVLPGCANVNVDLAHWWVPKPAGQGEPARTTPPAATRPASAPALATPTTGRAPATTAAFNPSWRDVVHQYATGTGLGAEHGANLIPFDTLAYPRSPVDVAVRLVTPRGLKPLPGVTVAFTRDTWVAGRVTTNADGIACLRWTPPAAGNYTFTARIVAVPDVAHAELLAMSPAEILVAAREKDTHMFVIDLDHTVVDSEILHVLLDGGKPMADSVPVTNRLAEQYGIVYLTNRPDLLTRRSKAFLKDNGYPPGPLLANRLKGVLDGGHFKTSKLADLRKAFPGVVAGVGDTLSDVQAYASNGMTAYLLCPCNDKPRDLRKLAAEMRALHETDRLQVVGNWRELEQAVFKGEPFTPQAFADRMDRRAKQLEADPKAKDKAE
jgi:hypothetical protein